VVPPSYKAKPPPPNQRAQQAVPAAVAAVGGGQQKRGEPTPEPSTSSSGSDSIMINLSTVSLTELQALIVDGWHYPKFRASQVFDWIRRIGVTDVTQMTNLPRDLRDRLSLVCRSHALEMADEWISAKDGTIKRAYRCGNDRQIIESVLMGPYTDGRYTACISSQAGCAQQCTFCATGQMGFARQLTGDEIFEQVARFQSLLLLQQQSNNGNKTGPDQNDQQQQRQDLRKKITTSTTKIAAALATARAIPPRLSNVVFMGMGEPLANYKNVKKAIQRITNELGIGARKITVSTVGITPMIRAMAHDVEMPPVKLAVSLHCADDIQRSALLPANARFGGLTELFDSLREYVRVTNRRITIECKLLHAQLDRPDLVHVNVIPLNPTGDYAGQPSLTVAVDAFCAILTTEYKIPCTPRVRRGIDIDAGCGQLKASVLKKDATRMMMMPQQQQEQQQLQQQQPLSERQYEKKQQQQQPQEYGDDVVPLPKARNHDDDDDDDNDLLEDDTCMEEDDDVYDDDDELTDDPEFESAEDLAEAQRLIALVENTKIDLSALSVIGKKK
jgi:23S rRNA (adenine2503-C2)-methyltransferase